ncbi:MAG: DoxX family protein [Actinomycetota bacterium]|nr:DoxX family protein [Actinomycetota bacterium]
MLIAYWIIATLLALVFLAAGIMKTFRPRPALIDNGMKYVEDLTTGQIKTIGILELLGALGLILPKLLDVAPILSPVAAVGLVITMIGAIALHIRRKEAFTVPLVLGLLSAAAAVLGFLTTA